jgi:hypothetical protein
VAEQSQTIGDKTLEGVAKLFIPELRVVPSEYFILLPGATAEDRIPYWNFLNNYVLCREGKSAQSRELAKSLMLFSMLSFKGKGNPYFPKMEKLYASLEQL